MMAYIKGFIELIKGLGITGKHLTKRAITVQYPEQKDDKIPENSRGIVVLLSDKEDGSLNCTACELCMRACPTAAITIDAPRDENKKKQLKKFEIDFALCCYCGLCEEACNFAALKLTNKYEFSTTDINDMIWDVNKLQDCGRDVDYIDTRKKKTPKPAPPKQEVAPANPGTETKPEVPKKPEVKTEDTKNDSPAEDKKEGEN